MALQKHDELNNRSNKSFEQYFGEMHLTDAEIKMRIEMAEGVEEVFMMLFVMLKAELVSKNKIDIDYYIDFAIRRYEDVLDNLGIDYVKEYPWLENHIEETTMDILKMNEKDSGEDSDEDDGGDDDEEDDKWSTSKQRANLIAKDEANTNCAYIEYKKAKEAGKTHKIWYTVLDGKERPSHRDMHGEMKPIDEPFIVDGSIMFYPTDLSNGANLRQICGCRCTCEYV